MKDTQTLRGVTIPDAIFDHAQVERIIHVMRAGIGTLTEDVHVFREAAATARAGDSRALNDRTAEHMDLMAEEFERYIAEAEHILEKIGTLSYDGVLAFIDMDGVTRDLIRALEEGES